MTAAIYLPSRDLVVVFTNKAFDVEDAECSWFHEQTHAVWHKSFTAEERERYGSAVLDYLKDKDFGLYNHIIDKYDSDKYKNEACSYLIEKVGREYGSDRFMSADFSGSEEIVKFVEAVQNYLRNGKRKEDGNQPRRVEADGKAVQDVHNGSNEGRESQEKSRNKIMRLLQEGSVIWRTPKDATTSSAERQSLDYEQPLEAETTAKGSGITHQTTSFASKDTKTSEYKQGTSEKSHESEDKNAPSLQKQVEDAAAVKNKGTVMPGLNDVEVKVVDVPRHQYKGTAVEAKRLAIADATEKYEGKTLHYNNFGTSFDYIISGNSIDKSMSRKAIDKSDNIGVHIAVLNHLDEVIAQSIEAEEHPDRNKTGNVRDNDNINPNSLMHRFYGAVRVDGKDYRVMTLMREDNRPNEGNGVYTYEVQKIEVLDEETPNTPNGAKTLNSELEALSVVKLLQNVEKSYDKGKKVLEESKKAEEVADRILADFLNGVNPIKKIRIRAVRLQMK